jgi:hypothetical protein
MGRDLAKEVKQPKYFESQIEKSSNEGTKEMAPLLPFVISGGKNTEYYYFKHINTIKGTSFNIEPEYFGKKSEYTKEFPKRISVILQKHNDAKIFCVFDFDTVYDNDANKKRHEDFVEKIKDNIDKGRVVLCPSMPCIEYWFLLHFEDDKSLFLNCESLKESLKCMESYFDKDKYGKSVISKLKEEKYIKNKDWVEKLCAEGKLEKAIERAENKTDSMNQSYSYVYKIFKS